MAIRTFLVTKYTIKVGDRMTATFGATTIKCRGVIACIGADNQRVVGYFLAPDSPIPAPTTTIGGKWGPVFLSEELMDAWVDILRHEKPLYGYINTDQPSWTNVSTTEEPVGEEES